MQYIAVEDRIVTDDYETLNTIVHADEFTTITLEQDHGPNPFVFARTQTRNNPYFATVRMSPTGENKFINLRIQTDAATEFSAKGAQEVVGLIVIKSGCEGPEVENADHTSPRCGVGGEDGVTQKTLRKGTMTLMGEERKYEIALVLTKPGDMAYVLQEYKFASSFERPPIVLAQVMTQRDKDPVYARIYQVSTEELKWGLDEDTCKSDDRSHESEYVALLAIEPPPPPSPSPSPSSVPTPSPVSPSPSVTPTISISASVTPPPGAPDNPAKCQMPPNGVPDPDCPMGTKSLQKEA
jgi:hypothetical protein